MTHFCCLPLLLTFLKLTQHGPLLCCSQKGSICFFKIYEAGDGGKLNNQKKIRYQAGSWKQKGESNRQIFKSRKDLAEMNYVILPIFIKMRPRIDTWDQNKIPPRPDGSSGASWGQSVFLSSVTMWVFMLRSFPPLLISMLSFSIHSIHFPLNQIGILMLLFCPSSVLHSWSLHHLRACFPARWWGADFSGNLRSSWKAP